MSPQKRPRSRGPVMTPEALVAAAGVAKSMRREVQAKHKSEDDEPDLSDPDVSDLLELPSSPEEAASSSKDPEFKVKEPTAKDLWKKCRSCRYPAVVRIAYWNRTGICAPPVTLGPCLYCTGVLPPRDG